MYLLAIISKGKEMSQSIRYVVRGVHGRVRSNFNWPAIRSRTSVVHITAAEIKPFDPNIPPVFKLPGEPDQNFRYWLGDANVWVSNISPHKQDHFDGEPSGVEFILHVDWPSPLDVAVTITVEDNFPAEV
jgi:hypothetical protein